MSDTKVTINWDDESGELDGWQFKSMGADARNYLAAGQPKGKRGIETFDLDDEDAERLSVGGDGRLDYD